MALDQNNGPVLNVPFAFGLDDEGNQVPLVGLAAGELQLKRGAMLNVPFAHAYDAANNVQMPMFGLHPDSPGGGGGGNGGADPVAYAVDVPTSAAVEVARWPLGQGECLVCQINQAAAITASGAGFTYPKIAIAWDTDGTPHVSWNAGNGVFETSDGESNAVIEAARLIFALDGDDLVLSISGSDDAPISVTVIVTACYAVTPPAGALASWAMTFGSVVSGDTVIVGAGRPPAMEIGTINSGPADGGLLTLRGTNEVAPQHAIQMIIPNPLDAVAPTEVHLTVNGGAPYVIPGGTFTVNDNGDGTYSLFYFYNDVVPLDGFPALAEGDTAVLEVFA